MNVQSDEEEGFIPEENPQATEDADIKTSVESVNDDVQGSVSVFQHSTNPCTIRSHP